jgi:RNA polymerase sigma-70 factor (ECF subfamily)
VAADPDEELVARSRAGDLEAFAALVDRHRDVVFRVAARIVGAEDAAEVSQDAFLRAFNRLDRFRGEGPFRAWLLQIAYNAALRAPARAGRSRAGRARRTGAVRA